MIKREANFWESILSLLLMFLFVFIGYLIFGLRVELMMVAAAVGAGLLALRVGLTWKDMEQAISERITGATPAILIIWVIGIVIGTFIFSGSIPMLIYYGIEIINPGYLLVSAFLLNTLFSIVTGSSWGSVGTVGVAMMSIASSIGVPLHITAGAVISGAIFGDKLSPLSETTNLAAATTGVDLYEHIKSMLWTTIPAAVISFIVFYIAGLNLNVSANASTSETNLILNELDQIFNWNILLLLPFVIILIGALMKKPPVPVMLLGCLIAVLLGVFFQGFSLQNGITAAFDGFSTELLSSSASEWSDSLLTLLNRGGLISMVGVVIIIYAGYSYTAIISKAGFLETALRPLTSRVKKRGPLMVTTLFTEILILVFSGTSYTVAIIIPEMFKKPFRKAGMAAKTLSRTIEDVGTMMAGLVPWGTSGAFYISTLGIAIYGSDGYAIWAVMTYITPIIAIILAFTGIGIYKTNQYDKNVS